MTEQNNAAGDADTEETKGGLKKIIFLVLGMILIAAVSVGATLFLSGAFDAEEPVAQEPGDRTPDGLPTRRAVYLALNPHFVVTYEVNSRQRFLQTELAVKARDQESLDTLTRHMPRVRNNIIQALSERTFSDIQTDAGRQELVTVLTDVLQDIVHEHTGRRGIETVLFSNFVLQ